VVCEVTQRNTSNASRHAIAQATCNATRTLLTKRAVTSSATQSPQSATIGKFRFTDTANPVGHLRRHLDIVNAVQPRGRPLTYSLATADDKQDGRRQQLARQKTVARGMLTRIQHFIEAGEHKINEIQVRFDKLSDIFNRYDTAQSELELSEDTDLSGDRELFENQYYHV